MRERTAKYRSTGTSPAPQGVGSSFPRILIVTTMALALGLFVPGCRGSNAQSAQAATNAPSGDPSDVNDAAAQSSCPNGQVLMSDGSCGNADAAPPQP
ncbi:MAG: hypothetical protein WBQ79_16765, partial [Acidobacteriaceae bacterium]